MVQPSQKFVVIVETITLTQMNAMMVTLLVVTVAMPFAMQNQAGSAQEALQQQQILARVYVEMAQSSEKLVTTATQSQVMVVTANVKLNQVGLVPEVLLPLLQCAQKHVVME